MFDVKTVPWRYGVISFISDDMFIGRTLEAYGEYCEGEPALWRKIISPGDEVIDIGANIGAMTIPLSHIVGPLGIVIAIEPQLENFDLLCRNVEQNELSNVTTINKAIGAVTGKTTVPSLQKLGHKNYGRVLTGEGDLSVDVVPLDDLSVVSNPVFIKIDVEGDEYNVLRGAQRIIHTHRPILYVENDRPEKSNELINYINSLNYKIFKHQVLLSDENDNWNNCITNVIGHYAAFNILCVPAEKSEKLKHITDEFTPVVPTTKTGKTGWVGIARFGGIGDNLIAASVLRPLKRMGYKIDVLSQMPQAVVFENNPFIDKLSIKDPARDLPQGDMQRWQDWFTSRANEYDIFVNLSHSCEVLLACFPAMTYFTWPAEFRRKQFGRSYMEMVHDIVGVPYEFGPLFFPTDEEREKAYETKSAFGGRRVIGWCLSGSRIDKVYPQSPMVIARLIKELDVDVVLLGAPPPSRDIDMALYVQEHVKQQNGSTSGLHAAITTEKGQWSIRRVLTFAGVCDLVISPDTGPAWAMAFEPMPKIILHSHASVENICKGWVNTHSMVPKVACHPCHKLHDTIDTCIFEQIKCGMTPNPEHKDKGIAACIASISSEEVVTTAVKLLGV